MAKNVINVVAQSKKDKGEFTFPELIRADKYMRSSTGRKRERYVQPGADEQAFGKKNLSNPKFIQQLRKLQEKHKITGIA